MAFKDLNSLRINDEEKHSSMCDQSGDMFEDMKVSPALIEILSRIDPALSQPQALYICPRRELAIKNLKLLQKMSIFTEISIVLAVTGEAARGVPIARRSPVFAHAVIGTPATIKKLIIFNKLDLIRINIVVFDEADQILAEDGLRDDSLKIMKEFGKCNPNFQLRLFSETLNQTVKDFVGRIVKDLNPNQWFLKRKALALESVKQYEAVCPKDQNKIGVINTLPDAIICHILSFLPTKIAASTSVLSRRWRYLLASVPNLDLDDSINLHPKKRDMPFLGPMRRNLYVLDKRRMSSSSSFVVFVDRVLALQSKFTVEKFSLKTGDFYDPNRVICWIHKVLARGVSDLHLVMDWDWGFGFLLPSKLFLSETLVRLRIKFVGQPANIAVEDFHLPKLKTLYLESVSFEKEDIGLSKLLAGCKVLEELGLECISSHMWKSCSVSVTTLKKLTFFSGQHFSSPRSFSFDTPNLVYLDYTEVMADKYPKVNFDSLVEAKIDFWMSWEQIDVVSCASASELEALRSGENWVFNDCTDFIKAICNVQSLHLSNSTLEVFAICCKAVPVFRNLTHLTIKSFPIFRWKSLPCLLKSCPNLETLVLKGLLHRCSDVCLCKSDDLLCLSTSPVKVVKILIDDGKIEKHVEKVKHFLETMTNLEKLVLYYDSSFDKDLDQVSTQLQRLTRVASPKCKVQLIPSDRSYHLPLPSGKWNTLL